MPLIKRASKLGCATIRVFASMDLGPAQSVLSGLDGQPSRLTRSSRNKVTARDNYKGIVLLAIGTKVQFLALRSKIRTVLVTARDH